MNPSRVERADRARGKPRTSESDGDATHVRNYSHLARFLGTGRETALPGIRRNGLPDLGTFTLQALQRRGSQERLGVAASDARHSPSPLFAASCSRPRFPFRNNIQCSVPRHEHRKHVTHPPSRRKLRYEMRPLYFCRIPLLIQSPRPVPFADLVLKKGSKAAAHPQA